MRIRIEPVPAPEEMEVLRPLLAQGNDAGFVALLEASLAMADRRAREALNPALYKALPYPDMAWPRTFADYVAFLVEFAHWIPQQSTDLAWLAPNTHGEHQEVYDRLSFFYWLVDQPVCQDASSVQSIPWFSKFLVLYARHWGAFLDTTASFNDTVLETFRKNAPKFRVEDSMIGDPLRPNTPSGWQTFNQFFARELNPGLRPISDPADNRVLTSPADCTFKKAYKIDEIGRILPPIVMKGTHTFATVQKLLEGSAYADSFNGGCFAHFFLGPYSYHRFHTPVSGIVRECYALSGEVYLKVTLKGQQFNAADSARDGYEFQQSRGVLIIDTAGSPHGDIGLIGVVPVGMAQVSGVNMSHAVGTACRKGDEFGFFTFGGSDNIVLMQAGAAPAYNAQFKNDPPPYSLYGSPIATVNEHFG